MVALDLRSPRQRASLRLRRRAVPLAALYRITRRLLSIALFSSLIFGGYRYFTRPPSAGALEFTPHTIETGGEAREVNGVASADLDHDGDVDIVTAGSAGIYLYENTGNKNFADAKYIDSPRGRRVQLVDIDEDGCLDILATLDATPGVRWYRCGGTLEYDGAAIGTGTNAQAYAADVNADGLNDVVTSANESGTYVTRLWLNTGSGMGSSTILNSPGTPTITALSIGDIDGNSYADIIVSGSGGLQVFDTDDGATWTRFDQDDAELNATHIVVADASNDGKNDIIVAKHLTNKLFLYKFIEHGQFQKVTLNPGADFTTAAVRDLDEDGDEDIVVTAQDDNTIYWYDNNGSAEFTQREIATDVSTVFGVTTADFDGDNDFDFATADFTRGIVVWYERTRAKAVATTPDNIRQTTDGAGRISFDTTISDGDFDQTRMRVQYSVDGSNWYKPWLIKVTPENGTVDLKNSNGYQVGTSNPIDTDEHDSVKLTLLWDTKASGNTGGPIVGDIGSVRLRVIPRDNLSIGETVTSKEFRVDNKAPQGLANVRATDVDSNQIEVGWTRPTDSSSFRYKLYYGTNRTTVLDQQSAVWDEEDDEALGDFEATGTTVTDIEAGKTYILKLFVVDEFGNSAAASSITVTTPSDDTGDSDTPTATATPVPTTAPTLAPGATATPTPTSAPGATATPTPGFPVGSTTPNPTPQPTTPSTTFNNTAPEADAGIDTVVNPSALVILDGTASIDTDNDPLTFVWRQLSGPEVELFSERTATPSFSAGGENETYIFALTVRDQAGASATDTVTIAVKTLPGAEAAPVDVGDEPAPPPTTETPLLVRYLTPVDLLLFAASILLTAISVVQRVLHNWREKQGQVATVGETPRGRVVHWRTGHPIVGALVLVYDKDGKLRLQMRTNSKGEFSTVFPPGQYSLGVKAEFFTFAPAASMTLRPEQGIMYSGGQITIPAGGQPPNIVIPMKPIGGEVTSFQTRLLHSWQSIQRMGRLLSWPVFIIGALLNTALIFWAPGGLFLAVEILYVFLVIIKVALEVSVRPAHGLVRDSITHVPIDLAVVRLFEQGTNRLVMTRVTDNQGKFFALPPAGTYMVTITKPGYGVFSKDNVQITSEQDSVLQMTADLMPVAPTGGLAMARSAVL